MSAGARRERAYVVTGVHDGTHARARCVGSGTVCDDMRTASERPGVCGLTFVSSSWPASLRPRVQRVDAGHVCMYKTDSNNIGQRRARILCAFVPRLISQQTLRASVLCRAPRFHASLPRPFHMRRLSIGPASNNNIYWSDRNHLIDCHGAQLGG